MSARDEQPHVWVVTPVHNGERYVGECIESVIGQTYSNWTYLVVDNCSTDRTAEIVREYAARDRRIGLHTNEGFLPIIENWNHALRQMPAEAEYCKVVHADDLLLPECLERMVDVAEAHPSVAIVSAYQLHGSDVLGDRVVQFGVDVVPGRDICRLSLVTSDYVFGSPTSILLRADAVRARDPFYDAENLHADTEACFDVLQSADLGFVHQVLTYTRLHPDAATNRSNRIGTHRGGWLMTLTKYGRAYLTQEEYERSLVWGARGIAPYAFQLAKGVAKLRFRDPDYRAFHGTTIGHVRRSVRAGEVARGLGRGLAAWLGGSSPAPRTAVHADVQVGGPPPDGGFPQNERVSGRAA